MTIDIDKMRAAHAACLPGKWEPLMTCGRLHVCAPTPGNDVATMAIAQEPVASFIALAHNEFPAMLDEIERLRDANADAYFMLCEFADTINNSLEGDHPYKNEVLQWITQHEDDRDD